MRAVVCSVLLASSLALAGCASDPAPAVDHAALAADWHAWVAARDSLFRSGDSPLSDTSGFEGLPYFSYDSTFAVSAALVPALGRDTLIIPTSSGALQAYVSAGQLVFEAGGIQRRLEAFQSVGGPEARLFIPFRDATTGRQSYGGGRYLDLPLAPSGRYALDLNRAYHPYCVYNPTYSCPLPPAENTLELAVTAGERLPEGYGTKAPAPAGTEAGVRGDDGA